MGKLEAVSAAVCTATVQIGKEKRHTPVSHIKTIGNL